MTWRMIATTTIAAAMKHQSGDDRARRQIAHATNAVTRRAAIAEPSAEPDQKAGDGNDGVVRRHLRHRHRVADDRCGERRGDQADDESEPPETIVSARVDKPIGDSSDAGDGGR